MAYVNDTSQGSGLLGRVFTALGQGAPDIRRGTLIQDSELPYRNLFGDYSKLLGSQTAGLDEFAKSYKALTPQLAGLDQLHASTYGDLLKQASTYDPTKNLQASGNYLFGNLDKYLNSGLQAGTAAMNRSLAMGGYGDRAPGGYNSILNSNRITSNLLPAFSGIVNALPGLASQQNSDYFRNLAQIPGFMQGQTDSLQATPFRALVPSQIQQSQLLGNLSNLNNLTQGEMANSYFYNQPSGLQKIANVFSGLYGGLNDAMDTVSKAASTYSNLATSGLGGQVGLGGSTQPTSQSGQNIDINQILSMLGKSGGGGMGGGGGGVNISQILSLLKQFGVGQQSNSGSVSLNNMGVPYYPSQSAYDQFYQPQQPVYEDQAYANSLDNPYSAYGGFFQ